MLKDLEIEAKLQVQVRPEEQLTEVSSSESSSSESSSDEEVTTPITADLSVETVFIEKADKESDTTEHGHLLKRKEVFSPMGQMEELFRKER